MNLTDIQKQIEDSLANGFVDQGIAGSEELMPQFIHNSVGDTMLLHVERELSNCSSFIFAIAFITEGALTSLKVKLADLAAKGIHGRILTSTYLNFNSPKAFQELRKLDNVEVRIAENDNFHAKGYIFDHENQHYQSAIIGSSNLTEQALMSNYEWNIKFTSYNNGSITEKLIQEVELAWKQATPLTADWINIYSEKYLPLAQRESNIGSSKMANKIVPNTMQRDALNNLSEIRNNGAKRALIISATGTGKTYLGAFDVASYQPKKFLYIVHREQILDKTMTSFKRVLSDEPDDSFGKISGTQRDMEVKYLFATIQTLSKPEYLNQFDPTEFDYILFDEAHRIGGETYQRVIDYFQPEFLLGMTATPERMDDFNLYEVFDYNIAYEIRLQQALDENMLCPFHYIGITDYEKDGEVSDDTSTLKWLVSDERVNYIIKQTEYYGYSGDQLQGLIFCSRKDEAHKLADLMTARGYPSKALTGEAPQAKREETVAELEQGKIKYIITVDVFNEGIDIPCVNQVVMLRNTQSSIVFIQQLGRGLRKANNKSFVTVIDFIGNYKNNYLIPIALNGDKSRSTDKARDDLEVRQISGVSTVNFSEIAKERIYQSINNTKLDALKVLRDDYNDLKNRLGRVPLLCDFQKSETVDCTVFADKYQNYYQFLVRMKEDVHLTVDEEAVLSFISIELMNGKRSVELILLNELAKHHGEFDKDRFEQLLTEKQIFYNKDVSQSVERVLSLGFFQKAARKKYGSSPLILIQNGTYKLCSKILDWLDSDSLFENLFKDAIQAGLIRTERYNQDEQFTLYHRYTRKDVCRLLCWNDDTSSTIYGYRVRDNECPIFVTYSKSDQIDSSINYQDRFINTDAFQWYTRHNVKLDSKEVIKIRDSNTTIRLFIKKNDDEGKGFYYFGEVHVENAEQQDFQVKKGKVEPIVRMMLQLYNSAQYDKYLLFEK